MIEERVTIMRLIAIDGNSLMHRAYYALPGMSSKSGTPTGALHGFLSMLIKLIEMQPEYLLVGFDMPVKTFRHEQYDEYKAGRRETPDDLRQQFPILKEILTEMGIAVIECERYEADDILGTFSRRANALGIDALLVTGDRDALQLITDNTHVLMTKKGISETIEYDIPTLAAEYGLEPARMVDLKGLMGDSSDNLPGIKGVGEKTALKLLAKYGDLESVLENAENEKGALREKLLTGAESARMSFRLGTIETNAPVLETVKECSFHAASIANALPILTRLELRAVAKRVRDIAGDPVSKAAASDTNPETDVNQFENVTITEPNELSAAVDKVLSCTRAAIDITSDEVTFIGENVEYNKSEYTPLYSVRLGGNLLEPGFTPEEVLKGLQPIFESENVGKLLFDAKRIMTILAGFGIECSSIAFDAMVADYLLNALHPSKSLDTLAEESGIGARGAAALVLLHTRLMRQLTERGMLRLYIDVELPLVRVLFDMEQTGFMIDKEVLLGLGESMAEQTCELSKEIYEQAGEKFNILSPMQLGHILFEKLGLPPRKKTKRGYSTDSDVLESLKELHPIVELIIEYRFYTKLKSTFVDAMLEKIGSDGRIHTTLNQNVTATGRISSQEPNLQNIPVRTEQGREIRRAFIASPGCTLVGADYSQIELRVLAHMSNDEALISAFIDGDDIHTRTAAEVFGVKKEDVTREMRSAAKAVNFGIVYGISAFGLSEQLGITAKQAGEYINKYLDRCTGVKDFMHSSVEIGKRLGYAETIMGRRRELPELRSSNYNVRSFGERVAMNMPIQGSAADIIKVAMVRVHERLKSEGLRAKLVLQIHDELIIDTPEDEVERVKTLLHECMCGVADLRVPLRADVSCGRSWFDTK
ncbi:MAG: DNA polymerase I [Christensenellaceae bacterium]|nr:DNA polymerase I [Christensenellaceae bacterium]